MGRFNRRPCALLCLAFAFSCGGAGDPTTPRSPADAGPDLPSDAQPPAILRTTPKDRAEGVLPESPITITFSESMAADSVVAGAIALSPPVRGSVSSSGATATFTPGSRLEYGTTYTATVKTSARDAAGNALQSPYSWTFRTIPPPPAPVAVTERESDANVSEMVALDATASLNPSGLPLIFTWTQTSGPDVAGPSGSLFGARPRFIAPAAVGTVEFDLVVDDGVHTSAPAHVQIDVLEDKSKAVFVHPEGNDANAGTTRAAPMKTIQAAIDKAAATGADVYVAAGVYQESLTLADGVSIYGAFDGSWVRNRGSVTKVASPTARALQGDAVRNLVIDGLTIVSAPASAPGESSYGILLANSGPVTISNDDVTAGDGAMGADGREGTEGAGGANGGDGENGCIDGTSCGRGRGGSGGIGFWVGGAGGRGGAAVDGSAGVSGLGPGAGRGGSGGAAANPGRAGSMGMNGSAGATGGDGALGAGVGPAVATGYVPVEGQKGWTGAPGSGGGGGGGGGGQSCAFFCLQGTGNGGGGGGGGGLGGSGGRGGQGGGGSFGIFLFASPAVAVAGSNAFHLGAGGAGGSGGPGGSGGRGGMGGHGATAGLGEIGAGGGGGNGGRGGDGGNGGRGASGPAMNVFR